ncbi:hypothetical protein PROFUN_05345 [Planoprotostelium fungivorum]|uniref:mitogen-activated protein kinase kinase n=1 Tax=Planoprotostelium fungivorum TaxID=1890364 RepID=A0A2P6NR46_9EUKA|nr:hypothetical protein PROFUN_05345 [Planoprotostelium fungivorum]
MSVCQNTTKAALGQQHQMQKKNRPPPIALKPSEPNPYVVSESGTFREGDISIGKKGLLVAGQSPQITNDTKNLDSEAANRPTFSIGSSPLELNDLEFLPGKEGVLGSGSSGLVKLARHKPSGATLAIKIIQLDVEENVRKQIILELKTLHRTQCEYVVAFYDAFFNDGNIYVALEYMEAGSLSTVMEKSGSIPEEVIARIAYQVLSGLIYLHRKLHLIHRDIKPCNLLINARGEVKISDFGVSGQLAHTLSQKQSWVGTVTYMSPERISGAAYSYDSDIWSMGLTLVECALGRFPYKEERSDRARASALGFWELMEYIVKQPPPTLDPHRFNTHSIKFTEEPGRKTLRFGVDQRPLDCTKYEKQRKSSSVVKPLEIKRVAPASCGMNVATAARGIQSLLSIEFRGSSRGKSLWGAQIGSRPSCSEDMGCGASTGTGAILDKPRISSQGKRLIRELERETSYSVDELERMWTEMTNLAEDGRCNERLTYSFLMKHKFGAKLIDMILDKEKMDKSKIKNKDASNGHGNLTTRSDSPADVAWLFPVLIHIMNTLRKGSIADQLGWYFALFDVNDDGEMDPGELSNLVKVLLENNPTMSEIITSDLAINRLVGEIFQEADDDGNGVLSLKEFLAHSKFITKKILLQNTSFNDRTSRIMKKMHGEGYSKFTKSRDLI